VAWTTVDLEQNHHPLRLLLEIFRILEVFTIRDVVDQVMIISSLLLYEVMFFLPVDCFVSVVIQASMSYLLIYVLHNSLFFGWTKRVKLQSKGADGLQ